MISYLCLPSAYSGNYLFSHKYTSHIQPRSYHMKKLASLIVALVFAAAIVFTVVDVASTNGSPASGAEFATIVPLPPPPRPKP